MCVEQFVNLISCWRVCGVDKYRYNRGAGNEPFCNFDSITGVNVPTVFGRHHVEIIIQRNQGDIINPSRLEALDHLSRYREELDRHTRKNVLDDLAHGHLTLDVIL